jgi:hypothetical protein
VAVADEDVAERAALVVERIRVADDVDVGRSELAPREKLVEPFPSW